MKPLKFALMLALLPAAMLWTRVAAAQASHGTAERDLQLSAFGAVGGDFTGLDGGKNFNLTVGVDLGFQPFHGVRPSFEVRGTYPTDRGLVDSQKSVMVGLRFDFLLGHTIHPYGDLLFGRGEMDYRDGYIFNNEIYDLTTTYVDAAGGGFDYDLSETLSLKVDAQLERWGAAPTTSGSVYSKTGSVGIVYRFGFASHGRR